MRKYKTAYAQPGNTFGLVRGKRRIPSGLGGGGDGGGSVSAETQAIIDRVEADSGTIHDSSALDTFINALVTGSVYNTSIIDGMWLPGLASKIDGSRNVSKLYDLSTAGPTAYRYYRLVHDSYSGSYPRVKKIEASLNGTAVFPTNMTNNTTPSPYVASSSEPYGAGDEWKAFDGSTGTEVLLGAPTNWLQIDLGSSQAIDTLNLTITSGYWLGDFRLLGSDTGSFSGEETVVLDDSAAFSVTPSFPISKAAWDLDGDASTANQQVLTTAAAGIDGLPMIDFDYTKPGYSNTSAALPAISSNNAYTVFIVYRNDDGSDFTRLFHRGGTSSNFIEIYNRSATTLRSDRGVLASTTATTTSLGIYEIASSGNATTDSTIYRNNLVLLGSLNMGSNALHTSGIYFGDGAGAVDSADGPLLATISCPLALTSAQRNTIFNALDALFPSAS